MWLIKFDTKKLSFSRGGLIFVTRLCILPLDFTTPKIDLLEFFPDLLKVLELKFSGRREVFVPLEDARDLG